MARYTEVNATLNNLFYMNISIWRTVDWKRECFTKWGVWVNHVGIICSMKEFIFSKTQWLKPMYIGCRPFSSLSKYIVQWKKSYLDIFNPSLFLSFTFKVTMFGVFPDVFDEFYIFAVIMGPFQTSFLEPYILNFSVRLKFKI